MVRRRGSAAVVYWRGMIERQAASGLTIWRFRDRTSVSTASFYAWRRKLKQRRQEPSLRTSPTQVIGPLVHGPREVEKLVADVAGAAIAIELPSGIVVPIPRRLRASAISANVKCRIRVGAERGRPSILLLHQYDADHPAAGV
jgi:hypothetical protein